MRASPLCALMLLLFAAEASAQQTPSLRLGQAVSATVPTTGALSYELELPAGRFVAGRVDQDGVDVMVTVTAPDGSQLHRSSRIARGGPEAFVFTTKAAGKHKIDVAPVKAGTSGAVRTRLTRSEPVATTPEGKVDQAAAFLSADTPGAVVGVIKSGALTFVKGYGAADLTFAMPFTPETPTNIGSTAKQFTGFAVALLASRGALSLDDDVRKHIPELKDFGKKITVRNLLTHTTGYREFINTLLIGGRQVLEGDYISPTEVIRVVNRAPKLQNEPGAEFNYNNSAFSLATIVVERVTGKTFPEFMRDEVFLPLGMTNTRVRSTPSEIIPRRSTGYILGDGGFREVRDLHGAAGAGGIYTTPADIAKWMGNFKTGKVGGLGVIKEMTTSFVLNDGKPTNYGLGLFLDTNRGQKRWQHGGNDIAHSSTFVYYPDLDAGYIVFSNYQGVPGGIAGVVADAYFGQHFTVAAAQPTTPGAVTVPPATLRRYAGKYEMTTLGGLLVTVELQQNELKVQLPGQPSLALKPTSTTAFEVVGAPARVSFNAPSDGSPVSLTFHQDGDHPGRRVADEKPAVNLASYTGRFYSEELETFYDLSVDDGKLVIHHARFGPAPLTHTDGDSFSGTLPVSQVVFRRNASGEVVSFEAGNGRARDILFEKVLR